jgi:serine/threonine protein kinase
LKLSNIIYIIRGKTVGAIAMMNYGLRGVFNPFTSSGQQFYGYRLLRFFLKRADDINVPTTLKSPSDQNEQKYRQGKFLEYKGFKFQDIRQKFLGNAPQEESKNVSENIGQSQTQSSRTSIKEHSSEKVQESSDQLLDETESFSILTNRREILGRRGRYRVSNFLGERGIGRLYKGTNISENKSVIIREYFLPGHIFNGAEIQQRKQEFERLAGVNLSEGRVHDFRVIGSIEAIADDHENRCYLITKGSLNFNPTLRDYLQEQGPMQERQVHEIIKQILQTLEFLHTHKFRLGNAQVQRGLVHGNINLDSILFVKCENQDKVNDHQFFVYATDLGIWENLFLAPTSKKIDISVPDFKPQVDLSDLGRLSFFLLVGRDSNIEALHPIDPRDKQLWPSIDPSLKEFILRLIGVNGAFESAEIARQAMPALPLEKISIPSGTIENSKTKKPSDLKKKIIWAAGGTLALGVIGAAIWIGFSSWKTSQEKIEKKMQDTSIPCCIKSIDFPTEKFVYASLDNDIWNYILKHPSLISLNKTLEQELIEKVPKLQLTYKTEKSFETALESLKNKRLDFLVTTLPESQSTLGVIESSFNTETIAYDGVAIFVAFSDIHRDKNIAKSLNGQITIKQLRQLYTGEVKNWKEIGGPNLPVKLYIPTDQRLIQLFEQRIFAEYPEELNLFRKLQNQTIHQKDATQGLRDVLQDFEIDDVGSIGFDAFSKVYGQCSVYPLAIALTQDTAIQALVQDNGQPINPKSDLCDDKGSYWLNADIFNSKISYPLKYKIAVLYPKGGNTADPGKKFADLWKTQEGQSLLNAAGLVPIISSPHHSNKS